MNLKIFPYESCATEYSGSDNVLYINSHLPCRLRSDLGIYKSTELELVVNEILNLKETSVIVGRIYHHPYIDLNESK